jgi:tripartite ATP-independent transporter DctM subunit
MICGDDGSHRAGYSPFSGTTAIPGVLMGLMLMIFIYFIAKRRNYPSEPRATRAELGRATLRALPPLGMPAIILGGIIGGVMTPTEAAAAGAAYAFILGYFIYREFTLRDLGKVVVESALSTAAVAIIISAAQPFGWVLTLDQAPQALFAMVQGISLTLWQLYLLLNIVFLIVGCYMEGIAVLVMTIPVIMPVIQQAGIDPVHFGVVFTVNSMIGTITPPVGMIMYVVCALGNVSIGEFSREVWPFLIALIVALLLVTYIPPLAMWLPNLLLPVK